MANKVTSRTISRAGVLLADTGNERESTMMNLKKSITNLWAGWVGKISLDEDLITPPDSDIL